MPSGLGHVSHAQRRSHWETLVSGVRGVFVFASGLSAPVTDKRQLPPQNHRGSVSSASPSTDAGVDPLCPRAPPTWAEGGRPLCLSVCQATNRHGAMRARLSLAKTQLSRNQYPGFILRTIWKYSWALSPIARIFSSYFAWCSVSEYRLCAGRCARTVMYSPLPALLVWRATCSPSQ